MLPALFITGASGYVGRFLFRQLDSSRFERVVCLVRQPDSFSLEPALQDRVEIVAGDLLSGETYRDALRNCKTVLHMAAVTGKSQPDTYFRTIVGGTEELIRMSQQTGVQNFLNVSTIAVKFSNQTRYYYAQAKKQAELVVAGSGLTYTTIRPTMVFGPGAPVLQGLKRLAGLPVVPIFGTGRVLVQPVSIVDLVDCLWELSTRERHENATIEIGGPQTETIEELLNRIRRVYFSRSPRNVHLPLGPIRSLLGLLEGCLLPVLPLTAGQLATFANDSTIEPNSPHPKPHEQMMSIDAMLEMESSVD